MKPGAFVILHLINPSEKIWGALEELAPVGITLRGINMASFEEWMIEIARGEPPTLGLATMFVPLFRVERMFLDEQVGAVASYRQRFLERVGLTVESYLGLADVDPAGGSKPS